MTDWRKEILTTLSKDFGELGAKKFVDKDISVRLPGETGTREIITSEPYANGFISGLDAGLKLAVIRNGRFMREIADNPDDADLADTYSHGGIRAVYKSGYAGAIYDVEENLRQMYIANQERDS